MYTPKVCYKVNFFSKVFIFLECIETALLEIRRSTGIIKHINKVTRSDSPIREPLSLEYSLSVDSQMFTGIKTTGK